MPKGEDIELTQMSNAQHLASVMVTAFIDAVNRGVDLVPVVADSTCTAKISHFIKAFPNRLVNVVTAAGLALGGKGAVPSVARQRAGEGRRLLQQH